MEWRDEGLIIGVRRHGEASTIVEALTRTHGRHLGLVRGGRSARLRATLQLGNTIGIVWRARLDEHLGSFAVEPLSLRAGRLMDSALALAGINYVAALVRVLPERDPHEAVYEAASVIAEALDDGALAPTLIARFEAQILAECGFRLDLSCCAATGVTDDLVYVSPKSGRAVSAEAGAPWRDRLLPLPPFLREDAPLDAAAERSGHRRRVPPDRLLSRPRPVCAPRGAIAGLPGRFSESRAGSAIAGGAPLAAHPRCPSDRQVSSSSLAGTTRVRPRFTCPGSSSRPGVATPPGRAEQRNGGAPEDMAAFGLWGLSRNCRDAPQRH